MMETYRVLGDLLTEEREGRPPAERALAVLCRGILSPRGRSGNE